MSRPFLIAFSSANGGRPGPILTEKVVRIMLLQSLKITPIPPFIPSDLTAPINIKFVKICRGRLPTLFRTPMSILVWDSEKRLSSYVHVFKEEITSFAVMQTGPYMYVGDSDGNIKVLKIEQEVRHAIQMKYSIPFSSSHGAALGCFEKSCKSFHVPCAKLVSQCRWDILQQERRLITMKADMFLKITMVALRAPNVYFENDKAINLDAELSRSRKIKCSCCGLKGAALGCFEKSCKSFHVPCAKLLSPMPGDILFGTRKRGSCLMYTSLKKKLLLLQLCKLVPTCKLASVLSSTVGMLAILMATSRVLRLNKKMLCDLNYIPDYRTYFSCVSSDAAILRVLEVYFVATGEMVNYYEGRPVPQDYNGGSKVIHSHKNCTEWAPNV
ncbi:hypothetical protein F3Y22_tig00112249pilonHSYRG00229 [Hibiscus syriacus]|uniref:PHD-type domain-containing protein n=1 Tax=Hibiscus syriacus TaxID=106335 RepID=A0A6A2X3Q0_HIBSY|nr:hypothetical protein F3Y22_tig00112249pilonHSYRG00229 [Hibiscus syriacus]